VIVTSYQDNEIVFVALCDQIARMENMDIDRADLDEMAACYGRVERLLTPGEQMQAYRRWSPMHYKRKGNTPTSFTCGWCKERIDCQFMETHIKDCRVTIEDVRNNLHKWLEE